MFRIRSSQLNALDDAAARDFDWRLLTFLRKELPEDTAERENNDLLEWIREVRSCALKQDIKSESGVTQYACVMMDAGIEFASHPDFITFLQAPGATPEERLEQFVDCMDIELSGDES